MFGEGPVDASLMFVGEQPGDQEDLAGRRRTDAHGHHRLHETTSRELAGLHLADEATQFTFLHFHTPKIYALPGAALAMLQDACNP